MTWKVLAATRFTNTITAANTNEIVSAAAAITVPTGKTWFVKEILASNILVTEGKFNAYQPYVFKSGGTDFAAADFTGQAGTTGFAVLNGAKANNVIFVAVNTTAALNTAILARNLMLAAGDEIKCGMRSGATIPAAGDIVIAVTVSGDEF